MSKMSSKRKKQELTKMKKSLNYDQWSRNFVSAIKELNLKLKIAQRNLPHRSKSF